MPQEINNILVENDISCHQQLCEAVNTSGGGGGGCSSNNNTTNNGAGECVEIMEDEEENEQSRIG